MEKAKVKRQKAKGGEGKSVKAKGKRCNTVIIFELAIFIGNQTSFYEK